MKVCPLTGVGVPVEVDWVAVSEAVAVSEEVADGAVPVGT